MTDIFIVTLVAIITSLHFVYDYILFGITCI